MFSYRNIIAAFCLFMVSSALLGQTDNTRVFWKTANEESLGIAPEDRWIVPKKYAAMQLQFSNLKKHLAFSPKEAEVEAGNTRGLVLELPTPDGRFEIFRVWRVSVLHPNDEAVYPDIRTYAGRGIDNPRLMVRLDHTLAGFHAMVLGGKNGSWFIDPYARKNTELYVCYFKKHFSKQKFDCLVEDKTGGIEIEIPEKEKINERQAGCGIRREYRLAQACTAEYALFHGANANNKQPALAAIVTTTNRITGVYERDCSVRLNLIPNDSLIIYTNPSTDPYTNGDESVMLSQNQTTCNNVIGSANYDIGHVFGTGGGGVASLGSVCGGSKAQGVSLHPNPMGDPFDIDYVSHEMGHQFNGQHTQYNEDCNRSNSSAMEPGSASTIMGYAGVCTPDVQSNSDDYFHSRSLQQIWPFVVTGGGAACDVAVSTSNTGGPSITALTNRTIPKSTPFFLTCTATDPNGDAMTYCWEQRNAWSNPTQPMPPLSTNASGPVFRSWDPVDSPTRYFPRLEDLLAGSNHDWEELPSVARTLNFRISVRDNNAAGGCVSEADMTVTVNASSGPFAVTAPNSNVTILGGTQSDVTWDVASSNNAPVSCANVEILISTDGGQNFTTLVASTPNDGTHATTFPNVATTQARIMVRAVGNIFFDVSDVDFTITFNPAAAVDFQDFKVKLHDATTAILQWQTATEKNNKGFHVQRSEGNTVDFENIAWVAGNGDSREPKQYTFKDADLAAGRVYYYRLQQVDFDQVTKQYSPVRAVSTGADLSLLRISPNPAQTAVLIGFYEQPESDAFQVFITDASGKLVQQSTLRPGNPIDVMSLQTGLYHVRIVDEGKAYYGRFVKQ